jgi:hypothetical protein
VDRVLGYGPLLGSASEVIIGQGANGDGVEGVAIGKTADVGIYGVAIGGGGNGGQGGVAVGRATDAKVYGVALGYAAVGTNHAVAIGRGTEAGNYGVAIGWESEASDSGVALGDTSLAYSNAVAIGYQVVNTEPNSTKIKGNLNMAGAAITNVGYIQSSLPKMWVMSTNAWAYASGENYLTHWDHVGYLVGGSFTDDTYWCPGVVGWVTMNVFLSGASPSAYSGGLGLRLYKNGTYSARPGWHMALVNNPSGGFSTINTSWLFFNDNATNRMWLRYYNGTGITLTNNINYTIWSGAVLP